MSSIVSCEKKGFELVMVVGTWTGWDCCWDPSGCCCDDGGVAVVVGVVEGLFREYRLRLVWGGGGCCGCGLPCCELRDCWDWVVVVVVVVVVVAEKMLKALRSSLSFKSSSILILSRWI